MELFLVRALERVIVVIIGGLLIYFGYRLFLAVKATGEGSAEVKLPGDMTVMVSRVGPGVFFALFGSLVIGASFAFPVHYSETELLTLSGQSIRTKEISGIGEHSGIAPTTKASTLDSSSRAEPSEAAFEVERLRVREHIGSLNQLQRLATTALTEAQKQRVGDKARAVKLYLMHDVWRHDWGQFADFQLWAEGGGKAVDSEAFRRAVDFFAYGQEPAQ